MPFLRSVDFRATLVLVCVLAVSVFSIPATACPFCSNMGKTLAEEVIEANLVVHATLSNARQIAGAPAGQPDGWTDFKIHTVIKSHPILEGKKTVKVPQFVPGAARGEVDYIVFAEVIDGRIEPYKGMPVDDDALVKYLKKSVELADAPIAKKLGFYFRNLDHKDTNISGDAYKQFSAAPYDDVVRARKYYDPEKVVSWLRDDKTQTSSSYRIGLYGLLLGVCGEPKHAEVLRQIVDDPQTRPLTGIDGLMGGYCVLQPDQGPDYVLNVLTDPKTDFNFRYAALRTTRFIIGQMKGVDKDALFTRMEKALLIPDISDLITDEFRKNKRWTATKTILGLYGKKDFDLQVVRRAIIRYALQCPSKDAQGFLTQLRKSEPQLVRDVEEILKFEEAQQTQIGT